MMSLLSSVCLQYLGNYSSVFYWSKFCGVPIIHFSVLHEYITEYWTSRGKLDGYESYFEGLINQKDQLYGETALHVAKNCGVLDQILDQFGSQTDMSIEDNFGNAITSSTLRATQTLLLRGKKQNQKVKDRVWNKQPLFKAMKNKNICDMYLLSKLGAHWLSFDSKGKRAIDVLLKKMEKDKNFSYVVNKAKILDNVGVDALLFTASKKGFVDCLRLILEQRNNKYDVDVRFDQYNRRTALHAAVENDKLACTILLLENGAFVDAEDFEKSTPLHLAAQKNLETIAKALISSKADVNAKDKYGKTPLNYAPKGGNVAKLLIKHGAKINAKGKINQNGMIKFKSKINKAISKVIKKKQNVNVLDIELNEAMNPHFSTKKRYVRVGH
jgi:hypothetical protein